MATPLYAYLWEAARLIRDGSPHIVWCGDSNLDAAWGGTLPTAIVTRFKTNRVTGFTMPVTNAKAATTLGWYSSSFGNSASISATTVVNPLQNRDAYYPVTGCRFTWSANPYVGGGADQFIGATWLTYAQRQAVYGGDPFRDGTWGGATLIKQFSQSGSPVLTHYMAHVSDTGTLTAGATSAGAPGFTNATPRLVANSANSGAVSNYTNRNPAVFFTNSNGTAWTASTVTDLVAAKIYTSTTGVHHKFWGTSSQACWSFRATATVGGSDYTNYGIDDASFQSYIDFLGQTNIVMVRLGTNLAATDIGAASTTWRTTLQQSLDKLEAGFLAANQTPMFVLFAPTGKYQTAAEWATIQAIQDEVYAEVIARRKAGKMYGFINHQSLMPLTTRGMGSATNSTDGTHFLAAGANKIIDDTNYCFDMAYGSRQDQNEASNVLVVVPPGYGS